MLENLLAFLFVLLPRVSSKSNARLLITKATSEIFIEVLTLAVGLDA